MNKPCRNFKCIALAVLFLPVFFSCSNHASKRSFSSNLNQIDALIHQGQYKDAEKLLDKTSKDAFNSWDKIGVFKRYNQINLKEKAEKTLVTALKKNPENLELLAVYSNFLTRNKRNEEALSLCKGLQGTKYGSFYSEIVLRDTIEKSQKEELKEIFKKAEYFPIYYDAYTGTGNNAWLRNCSLLRLAAGAYEGAASVKPESVYGADDAYFWAMVMYDAARYGDAVNYVQASKELYPRANVIVKSRVNKTQLFSLEADSYTKLADAESAEAVRQEYLASIEDKKNGWKIPSYDDETLGSLPVIFVNSARWANDTSDDKRASELLTFCVKNWPDFVPGLVSYADFAWQSNLDRKEDYEQMALRDAGLATLEMERYDSRAKIPVSDALYRINQSIERTHDPLLNVVSLDLNYKTNKTLSQTERNVDLFKVMEKNAVSPFVYPVVLVDYALSYLLSNKQQEQAWTIFEKHISSKYSIEKNQFWWDNFISKMGQVELAELEYGAYFAALFNRGTDAKLLYEYAVFEGGDSSNETRKILSPYAEDKAAVNLAMIYGSFGLKPESLELYSRVSGRCTRPVLKSTILYRMALIHFENKDFKNARRCCEYSVTLNPKNVEAKLLLSRINNR